MTASVGPPALTMTTTLRGRASDATKSSTDSDGTNAPSSPWSATSDCGLGVGAVVDRDRVAVAARSSGPGCGPSPPDPVTPICAVPVAVPEATMRGVLLRSTAGTGRVREAAGRCWARAAQVGCGDVRGAGCAGQPSPAARDAERRAGRARRAPRRVRSTRVTPAGPERRPRRVRQRAAFAAPGDRPPRGDPRRGARPGAHRPVLRRAHRRGPHRPPVRRRRRARLRAVRRPVRPRRPGGLGRALPAGHARAGDARARGRRRPDARRGGLDLVHRRARGRPGSTRTPPAAPSPGCCRRASARWSAAPSRPSWRSAPRGRPPTRTSARTCRPGAPSCAPRPASHPLPEGVVAFGPRR